jgi:hypothetical protein
MNEWQSKPRSTLYQAGTDQQMLDSLLKETFDYFLRHTDPVTGLIADKTKTDSPSSIGVVGMGISAYIVGIKNNFLTRADAAANIKKVLHFIYNCPQGPGPDATGYKGFYYHFLDMKTGKRVWNCEISTIDSAFFIAGALHAAEYFTEDTRDENEIRHLAQELYLRVDWQWALNGSDSIANGWIPETGFIPYRWNKDYSEAMILYMLALSSPSFPIPESIYKKWTASFELKNYYNIEYVYAGPLFIHQFSHLWIDFKGINDELNTKLGFDYFENSRRATYVHREYGKDNPLRFEEYNEHFWGLSACDGPGEKEISVHGKKRTFYGYVSRGAPEGPDDGTVSPWSVVASLPFAPEIVMETIRYFIEKFDLKHPRLYGFEASFNPTYPEKNENPDGWVSPWRFGLNQGAIVIMIENFRSGLIWNLTKKNSVFIRGLKQAGFSGGWLDSVPKAPLT